MKKKGHNIVLTSTQKTNENAQYFYKKRGYSEIGDLVIWMNHMKYYI